MTKKIFKSILSVAAFALLASLIVIMGCLYNYFGRVRESQLKDELSIAAAAVEENGMEYLKKLRSDNYRITWVAADGAVIYDTKAGAGSMENHAGRAEIREAVRSGEGKSSRYSATLLEKTVYYAKALQDGSVLRISVSHATAGRLAMGMLPPVLIILSIFLFLSGIFAGRLSKRIVEPLNRLDLEHPLENDAYDELSPLLCRISQQRRELSVQLRKLKQRTDEFAQITGSMNECLVLLDDKGIVLSINPAAQKLYHADEACVGQDFLTIDRSYDTGLAVKKAVADGHSGMRAERGGREYQFNISRIDSEGMPVGAVLLAFDITEQKFAERNRREFTANVSHELKTPLQGIIGSADLIENGMVRPEDLPRFVGHIRKEASRLVALIEDIIRLSQLDEGNEMPFDNVDLLELAEEVESNLCGTAAAKGVKVSVSGSGAVVNGVRRLLYEIVYNLCDNAVKYNVDGGIVEITVKSDEKGASVTVRDTGIGIAPEHQTRIFERFYRVDQSHSKASGGTGLGLSIVKHAVQYHRGKIELQSEVKKGTVISVYFKQK